MLDGTSFSENDVSITAVHCHEQDIHDPSQDGRHSSCSVPVNMDSETSDDGFQRVIRKRTRPTSAHSSSSVETICTPKKQVNCLTVIFVPVAQETRLTTLNSLKVSNTLEQLCQECIIQVRYNSRLNLIAVDVRNGQAAQTLLNTTELCTVPVRAYSPLSRPTAYGVIKGVAVEVTDDEIAQHLRTEDISSKVVHVRRLGGSSTVKIAFSSSKLPSYVLLGHVRHVVSPFKERPLQCHNCNGFGHKKVACQRPKACSRCGEHHDTLNAECQSATVKCINCQGNHQATSHDCPKWINERNILTYSRENAVAFPVAKSALSLQSKQRVDNIQPLSKENIKTKSESKTYKASGTTYASVLIGDRRVKQAINTSPESIGPRDQQETLPRTQALTKTPPERPPGRPATEKGNDETAESPIAISPPWVSIFGTVANITLAILSKIETSWARIITSVLQTMLPILGAN